MEGRKLLQYIIDTSDVVLAKKQEATEYLAQLEGRPTKRAADGEAACVCIVDPAVNRIDGICLICGLPRR